MVVSTVFLRKTFQLSVFSHKRVFLLGFLIGRFLKFPLLNENLLTDNRQPITDNHSPTSNASTLLGGGSVSLHANKVESSGRGQGFMISNTMILSCDAHSVAHSNGDTALKPDADCMPTQLLLVIGSSSRNLIWKRE